MNVLILGGNGYIGSKVTHMLYDAGHSIVCTKRIKSDLSRLNDIKNEIKWIPASIDGLKSALQYMYFDYVLNMACNYDRNTILYDNIIDANIEFPLNVLNTVVAYGTKKYLTIGTGLPDKLNMYSFSKKMFSEFGRFYVEKHRITFHSLLPEIFYGADEPGNRFLSSIISKMINGEPVETTLGTQHRDIISSDDIVKAILLTMYSNLEGFHEIPVGTGVAPTISEIVDFIWDKTGRKSKVYKGSIPVRMDEPDCVADTSTLQSLGEWNPMPWKKGLADMINTLENRMRGGVKQPHKFPLFKLHIERRYAA